MIIEVNTESAMKAFGARIGAVLKGGEIIELVGDVGAGKTTLTKGIAHGLGVDEEVQSPSFTISRVYDARGGLCLAHYDFYRLTDAGIMADDLGEVVNDPRTVVVIEWAEVVKGVLPHDRLTMTIVSTDESHRRVTLTSNGVKSEHLLKELQ